MTNKISLVVIGQFPPPVNGLSLITSCITEEFRREHTLRCFDLSAGTTTRGGKKHLKRLNATIKACQGLLQNRNDFQVCYIACDGSLGLIYTIMNATVATLLGYKLFIHHHSYAYIDSSNLLMRVLLFINRKTTHIFLCETMQRDFQRRYRVVKWQIVSNSAFVPPMREIGIQTKIMALGLLSNLTREKGLYTFIELLRRAVFEGLNVKGILAGPVAHEADRIAIAEACRELGEKLEYRGAVYNVDKDVFYRDIDVFIFPTQHIHEAQPKVIFEALAAGCKVVSFDRGCISNQVRDDGLLVPRKDDFVFSTLEWLNNYMSSIKRDRMAIMERYHDSHTLGLYQVQNLINGSGG